MSGKVNAGAVENVVNVEYAQAGTSVNTDELGMREMQRRVFEHRNAQ